MPTPQASIEVHLDRSALATDPAATEVVELLRTEGAALVGPSAILYHHFPLYRADDGQGVILSELLLVTPRPAVVLIAPTPAHQDSDIGDAAVRLEAVDAAIYARLLRNRALRSGQRALRVELVSVVYVPSSPGAAQHGDVPVVRGLPALRALLATRAPSTESDQAELFGEVVATIEGSKGLAPPRDRRQAISPGVQRRAQTIRRVETEIKRFDTRQKAAFMRAVGGPERVRGLAGSGKTVVLAMKAAITLIREPDAKVLFTYNTKVLHQHVRRLITRFYRMYDDRDPDWQRMQVMHAWGGRQVDGVYYCACQRSGVRPLPFAEAQQGPGEPFANACADLLKQVQIRPAYDVVLLDEAQDLPLEFVRLCRLLTRNDRLVIAYDEFQDVFNAAPRDFGQALNSCQGRQQLTFSDTNDIVLHKCYRNPREVTLAAHALGLGIYGRIVQMPEGEAHWRDLGYEPLSPLRFGERADIERPAQNSLCSVSEDYTVAEIVSAHAFNTVAEEVRFVVDRIKQDVEVDGVAPEDIMVISLDDRYAKTYLNTIGDQLTKLGVGTNNVHSATDPRPEFTAPGCVTLSTSHKARGNEAYLAYLVGVDAPFVPLYPRGGADERFRFAEIRARNTLFGAMSRTKAWLVVTGVGGGAANCKGEIETACLNFPRLSFVYPTEEEFRRMRQVKRDLSERAAKEATARRLLEELESLGVGSIEDIKALRDAETNTKPL